MKVGDLVTVAPGHERPYVLVSLTASHEGGHVLPECVTLFTPYGGPLPMDKKFVKVVSEGR